MQLLRLYSEPSRAGACQPCNLVWWNKLVRILAVRWGFILKCELKILLHSLHYRHWAGSISLPLAGWARKNMEMLANTGGSTLLAGLASMDLKMLTLPLGRAHLDLLNPTEVALWSSLEAFLRPAEATCNCQQPLQASECSLGLNNHFWFSA